MKPDSPFQYNRWESDIDHIIWLPPEFSEWEGKKCVYITGSRGTGKTTILRGLEWKYRLRNKSLNEQLKKNPFKKRYIGVYLNMPEFISEHFINWPPRKDGIDYNIWDEERGRIYSLYIEYQILQLFIVAIQELRGENILKFSPEDEFETVETISLERSEIKNFSKQYCGNMKVNTLSDLRLCFKRMHENIRSCAINDIELQPISGYPTLQMGKMLEEVVSYLINLCSKGYEIKNEEENTHSDLWTLKVCIDQSESPEHYQQKAINTMVAVQETGNLSFAIASLSGTIDINSTYIPKHPLTDADRKHFSLEEIYGKPSKFHKFVEAVSELRFKKFCNNQDISIDIKYILGEWDINALLLPILKKSENKKAKEFIKRAEKNQGIEFFDFKRKDLPLEQLGEELNFYEDSDEQYWNEINSNAMEIDSNIPPLYQTYIVEKLEMKLPHQQSTKYEIRAQKSREIRKKMVAAMLCLCKEYKVKQIPYAGYYMIMNMSDQSIRDFLRQMHEIYIFENKSAEKFIKSRINIKTQNIAIHQASENRFRGIRNETTYYLSEVVSLINSLGQITAKIQSSCPSSLIISETILSMFFLYSFSSSSLQSFNNLSPLIEILK